jgi:predicted MPP superfamily phosphohydrolase
MRDKLTWLHISDIHFLAQNEWRDSATRASLLSYLKSTFDNDSSLKPDLIFCTGDIAFGEVSSASMSNQYIQAKDFFDELLGICGSNGPLPKNRLYVVPGNHDVNRKTVNSFAQRTLTSMAIDAAKHVEEINQAFNNNTNEIRDTIKRLDEYSNFVSEYLPHQQDSEGRHHYARVVDIDGMKIGVAGFNSAWSCSGNEDDRHIWLAAKWQFNAANQALAHADIRVGLVHHLNRPRITRHLSA